MDQGTIASVFRTTHIRPFRNDVPDDAPPDDLPMDKEVEENAPISAKEDLPLYLCIKVRIPRHTKEELECELIKYLPLPDMDIFMIILPPIINNKPDPYILNWYNIDFLKSHYKELNGLLEK
jgi:hypothetical protein